MSWLNKFTEFRHPTEPSDAYLGSWDKPQVTHKEIIGVRSWHIRYLGEPALPRLYSFNCKLEWEGPVAVADRLPAADNGNGIYSWKPSLAQSLMLTDYRLFGEIGLSGLVVECQFGYRAERATVRRLYVGQSICYSWPTRDLAQELSERYQCDCEVFTDTVGTLAGIAARCEGK